MIKLRPSQGDDKEPKRPKFIILDSDHYHQSKEQTYHESQAETIEEPYTQSFQKLEGLKFSFMLRVLTLIGAFFVFCLSFFVLIAVVICLFFALVTLFYHQDINNSLKKAVYAYKKITAIWFGLLVATISPALGLGLILLYFMLHKEKMNNVFFSKIYK